MVVFRIATTTFGRMTWWGHKANPMGCFNRFLHDETGSVTIEFVLWIPIIVALLTVVIDATTLYVTHTEMENVARDTARRMVLGRFATTTQAEAYAANAMRLRNYPYYVGATYDVDTGAEVAIAIQTEDMWIMGYSPLRLLGSTVGARVVMRANPRVAMAGSGGGGGGSSGGGNGNGNGNGSGGTGSGGTGTGGTGTGGSNGNGGGNGKKK